MRLYPRKPWFALQWMLCRCSQFILLFHGYELVLWVTTSTFTVFNGPWFGNTMYWLNKYLYLSHKVFDEYSDYFDQYWSIGGNFSHTTFFNMTFKWFIWLWNERMGSELCSGCNFSACYTFSVVCQVFELWRKSIHRMGISIRPLVRVLLFLTVVVLRVERKRLLEIKGRK